MDNAHDGYILLTTFYSLLTTDYFLLPTCHLLNILSWWMVHMIETCILAAVSVRKVMIAAADAASALVHARAPCTDARARTATPARCAVIGG